MKTKIVIFNTWLISQQLVMWNLEMKMVCELLFTTRELTVEDIEESFQREDEQKKAKKGYKMSTVY